MRTYHRNSFGQIFVIAACFFLSLCGVSFAQTSPATPALGVSSTSVNFGDITVGQTVKKTVTLTSTGTAPVTISGISVAGSLFTASGVTAPLTLNPGQTATLTLSFYSPHVSSFTGIVTVASNSSKGNVVVNMSGNGVAGPATLSVSSTNVDFGSVVAGQTVKKSITLKSTGTTPVTISSMSVAGSLFAASGVTPPATLNPGQTATLTLSFTSPHVSTFTGVLTIASNSSTGNITVNMSGSGISGMSAISCANSAISGAGTDACTVSLGSPAPAGGQVVNLTSNNAAVTVPTSVTVPANATSATFTATIKAVTTAQTAALTATSNGASTAFSLKLNPSTSTLTVSSTSVSFGNVTVGLTAKQTITLSDTGTAPVTISSLTVSGSSFTTTGMTAPTTLKPGQSATLTLQFNAGQASTFTGTLTIASNASPSKIVVNMSGTGAASLSALSCSSASLTGGGSDACTVTLSGAAPDSGLVVALSSSNAAVSVPAAVTVPSGAKTSTFNATTTAVSSAQSVTLTASAGSVSKTFALQLNPGSSALTLNATSIAFGNVIVNSPATQSITLKSSGTAAVTVNSATATGTGFSVSGMTFPATLNPGQTATLNVQFDPTSSGAKTGQVTITSNASGNGKPTVALTGTGTYHQVSLTWNAPSGSTISGYRVYRAVSGSSSYQVMNSSLHAQTSFTDSNAQSSTTYQYYVTSVDSTGAESTPSNTTTVTVP
jgi:Abnormal spindle-like microcephaly-assoc'd, ASPM-SPD-2-Hydin/Protein of unknown function (DUF1573)